MSATPRGRRHARRIGCDEVTAAALDRCIWCLRSHGESSPSKAEHIIGSALGYPRDANGAAFALRNGEVCKDCNNNRLAQLDRLLGDEFDLARLVAGVGDDPKLLRSRHNARAMRDETGHLHLAVNNGPGLFEHEFRGTIPPPRGDGRDVFMDLGTNTVEVAVGGSPEFSHAVQKVAFEIFAAIVGREPALSSTFDAVRGFVMRDEGVREVIMASPPSGLSAESSFPIAGVGPREPRQCILGRCSPPHPCAFWNQRRSPSRTRDRMVHSALAWS